MRNSRSFFNRRHAIVCIHKQPSWWNFKKQWAEEYVHVVGTRSEWKIVPGFKDAPADMVQLLATYEVRLFL